MRLLLLSLFSWISVMAFAQKKTEQVDILWGPEQKESGKSTLSDIIGYDETGFYALKKRFKAYGKEAFFLAHYDNEMVKTKSEELLLRHAKKKMTYNFSIYLKNNLYIFSSQQDQKLKKNILYVQRVDKKTLQLEEKAQKIAEIDYAGYRKNNPGAFSAEFSNDSSKVLIHYKLPYDKGTPEVFGLNVLDHELNQLWEKKVTLPYLEEEFNVEGYKVSDAGDVYLLGIVFESKQKNKGKRKTNYKYHIISYLDKGKMVKEYPIEVEQHFLRELQIAINKNNDIIGAGLYSAKESFDIQGSFFLSLDGETKEIRSTNFKPFGLDFIVENLSERKARKVKQQTDAGKDVGLVHYDLSEIILREDGGAILVGEQFYRSTVHHSVNNDDGTVDSRTDNFYYYKDILVINMSPEGNILWTEKIPKRQKTANDKGNYSSHALAVMDDQLFFVFNDHPNNLLYDGVGKLKFFKKGKESLVVVVRLNSEGEQTREALFTAKNAEVMTKPKVCEQITNSEMVIFGQKGKTQRFAKLTFKR